MTVYLAWSPEPFDPDLSGTVHGPWHEVLRADDHLLLVDSDDTLSRVYHELKWSLVDDAALVVTPVLARPKLKGLAPGTTTWLRDRVPVGPHDVVE